MSKGLEQTLQRRQLASKHEKGFNLIGNQGDATTWPSKWLKLKRLTYQLLVIIKNMKQKFCSTAAKVYIGTTTLNN